MAHRWKVLIVASVVVGMALLDVTIVNIAFPDIRKSFPDSSLAGLSWILNGYSVVFAAALVPVGRLADRLGRRRLFLLGVVVFLAASVLSGAAPSVGILVAARVCQALGGAMVMPTSLGLVLPEFPLEQRATATALLTATGAVAAAAGPSLGGVLVAAAGWRSVFFVNLVIGIPMLIIARRLLRESGTARTTGWPDAIGSALLVVGVGGLTLAIVQGPAWGWASARTLIAVAVAVVALAAFVPRSARHPTPVIDLSLFRVRSFAVSNTGTLIFGAGFYASLLSGVLFLTTEWHYSVLRAGAAITPGPVAAALMAPIAGRLCDRYGQRVVAVPGNVLFAAGAMFLLLRTGSDPHYWARYFPAGLLTGIGIGLSLPALSSAAVAELPRPMFATGSAIIACFRQLGGVLGIAVLVVLVGTPNLGAFQHAWLFIATTGVLAALVSLALGRVRARDIAATVGVNAGGRQ